MKLEMDKTILVRNVDAILWNKTVAIARYRGIKAGELLSELLNVFIEKQEIIKEHYNIKEHYKEGGKYDRKK
jgi:hypothetical protein|tara:strand:+ start:924 stop:1139 length:216 start_codon:yes stop_codon:yes gene_type:complete